MRISLKNLALVNLPQVVNLKRKVITIKELYASAILVFVTLKSVV